MTLHDHALANGDALLADTLARVFMPPPPVDYLEWAKNNVVFSSRISDRPGPYDEEAFPFFSEILAALGPDDPCSIVTLMKSAQVGGTVAANIFTMGSMAMDPGDLLYVHPNDGNAAKWSKQKLMPLLKETPSLMAQFPVNSREGGNSVLYKERRDGRGAIAAAGANSPAQLSMVSPKRQVQDDLAKWESNAAGDPEMQADSRSKAFSRRKIFKISTPLVWPGCRITRNYRAGSMETYHVPCPHCGHLQALEWENMEPHLDPAKPERAAFLCTAPGCGGFIEEHHRATIMRSERLGGRARWVAKHPERKRHHRSFHIWVAYSRLESWAELARKWIALKAGRGTDDNRDAEQVFANDWRGVPHEGTSETLPHDELRERADVTGFSRGVVPRGALVLTLGVDVQGDRCEWQLLGWGRRRQRHVIDHGVIDSMTVPPGGKPHSGHVSEPEMRTNLDALLARAWPDFQGNMRRAELLAIDGNYATTDVYDWARRHPMSKVIMVRGQHHEYGAILTLVKNERDRTGKKILYSKRFFNLAVSVLKSALYRDLAKKDPEATGYVHFCRDLPEAYFEQLVSERRIEEKGRNGVVQYRWALPDGLRNEALDTMNAAFAAAWRLGLFRWTDDEWDRIAAIVEAPPLAPQLDLEEPVSRAPATPAGAETTSSVLEQSARIERARQRAAALAARRD